MPPIFDLRPTRAILADCRDLRRQAREYPSCAEQARRLIRRNQHTLLDLRHNRETDRFEKAARAVVEGLSSGHLSREVVAAFQRACDTVNAYNRRGTA